jgi:hypothetical protein
MSRTSEVIKNKNRVEKTQRARRQEEIRSNQTASAFRARLYEELKKIDLLLDSEEIESIVITIPNQFLAQFGEAIYSEDLAEYDIQQVPDTPNQFYVRHRYLQI